MGGRDEAPAARRQADHECEPGAIDKTDVGIQVKPDLGASGDKDGKSIKTAELDRCFDADADHTAAQAWPEAPGPLHRHGHQHAEQGGPHLRPAG